MKTNYTLYREDHKGARFYWSKSPEGKITKDIGITSLASKCLPDSEELIRWQLQKDPDGRLIELAQSHGTLEHIVCDALDRGLDWNVHVPQDYKYERMLQGSLFSWRKFLSDYNVEVLESEFMLRYENGNVHYAATLDKIVYLTRTVKVEEIQKVPKIIKEKTEVPDGIYQKGKKAGQPRTKKIITEKEVMVDKKVMVEKEVKELAIIDLKSNFFEKDKKQFYESHQFQLWGQRLAFMQSFPDMGIPNMYNFSPSNFKVRQSGNLDNLYTLKEWSDDYSWDFNWNISRAVKKGWLEPQGKIEIFTKFKKDTPLNECYKALTYDEYIAYKLEQQALAEKEMEKREEFEQEYYMSESPEDLTEKLNNKESVTP